MADDASDPSHPSHPMSDRMLDADPHPTFAWLAEVETARREAGLRRRFVPRPAPSGREDALDLAGNDYLGLARDPGVAAAAAEAARRWGAGATGSRLVTGTTTAHVDLERALARFLGAGAGLVFASGYAANLGAVQALSGPGSLVVSTPVVHASLIDACRLSRARVVVARTTAELEHALATRTEARALVVTDSIGSAGGEVAPLAEWHALVRRHAGLLLVDEAHGLGVRGAGGRGLAHEVGLAGEPDVVLTLTLSKALGSQGGAVCAHPLVIDHLVDQARTFIFDTGLAPAAVAGAHAALERLVAAPELATRVREVAARIAAGVGAPTPTSAIVSLVIGEPDQALAAADACQAAGVRVACFRPPSVPEGTSRLRLSARADLTDAQVQRVVTVVRAVTHVLGSSVIR